MTRELRARMERFVEFINSADEEIGNEIVSPSATFHVPFLPGPVQGPAGYLEIIGIMRQAFPDVQWSLEEANEYLPLRQWSDRRGTRTA